MASYHYNLWGEKRLRMSLMLYISNIILILSVVCYISYHIVLFVFGLFLYAEFLVRERHLIN
jgi:hypothetical protein